MRLNGSGAGISLPRLGALLLLAVALNSCKTIDDILEAEVIDGYLQVATETGLLTMAQGEAHTMTVRVTRPAGIGPNLQVLFSAPAGGGITATFGTASTNGQVTTYDMTIQVAPTAMLGQHAVGVRSKGTKVNDGLATILLTVLPPPSYELTVSTPAMTIARGGIAPLVARVARTNMPSNVTLSIDAPASASGGITASFDGNPVSGDSTKVTIQVAGTVPAGTYPVSIRGATSGLADRSATLSLVVSDDALQIIAPPSLGGAQGAAVQTGLILNRATVSGTVAFTAENLPTGVSVGFSANAGTSTTPDMIVNIGPTTPPGEHQIRVRASGTGVPDATADVGLSVSPTTVSIGLQPASLTVFVGASASTTLTIARTGSASLVNVAIEGVPAGMTVTPSSPNTTAQSIQVVAAASPTLAPGDYSVTVRATPAGFPVSASQTATLALTVRAAATSGNVIVDFSSCTVPSWFAFQNGSSAWTTIMPTAGVFRFTVNQGRGGFAYAAENTIAVRLHSQSELTVPSIDMCGPQPGTKVVNGSGFHQLANETFQHRLGGGSATSTTAQPSFTITNVAAGVHDLVSWGNSGTQTRAYIRRDLNPADGESIGMVDLTGPDSYVARQSTWSLGGPLVQGESTLQYTMSYLTTAACVNNPLYTNSTGFGSNMPILGIPLFAQRPTDFHMITVQTNGTSLARTVSVSFKELVPRSVALGAAPGIPFIQVIPPDTSRPHRHKILQTTINVPTQYQTGVTLEYASVDKIMRVTGSLAYYGSSIFTIAFPDLSGVGGFPQGTAIPSDGRGTWSLQYEGISTGTINCVEGRVVNRARRWGNY